MSFLNALSVVILPMDGRRRRSVELGRMDHCGGEVLRRRRWSVFGLSGYDARQDQRRIGVVDSGRFQQSDPLLETFILRSFPDAVVDLVVAVGCVAGIGRMGLPVARSHRAVEAHWAQFRLGRGNTLCLFSSS